MYIDKQALEIANQTIVDLHNDLGMDMDIHPSAKKVYLSKTRYSIEKLTQALSGASEQSGAGQHRDELNFVYALTRKQLMNLTPRFNGNPTLKEMLVAQAKEETGND